MLLSFSFSNFGSFALDKTNVSLRLTKRDPVLGWDRYALSGQRATTALVIVGANGAGKTSVLKALGFITWFIHDSFGVDADAPLPLRPHILYDDDPAHFEMEMEDAEGTTWYYHVEVTRQRVLHESLRKRALGTAMRRVFTRDWNARTSGYTVRQTSEETLPQSEAVKVRPNVSFLSWARQYGVALAPAFQQLRAVTNSPNDFVGPGTDVAALMEAAGNFKSAPQRLERATAILLGLDLGLSDIEVLQVQRPPALPKASAAAERDKFFPYGAHSAGGKIFQLPFFLESAGTRSAFVLLRHLLEALETGAPAFIDELDAILHPHMLEPLLRLFDDTTTNPHGAQLIFTVQNPEALSLMKPAQVLFVEKNQCMSTAYRGDEIDGLRAEDNLYGKYMAGALGAIPQL